MEEKGKKGCIMKRNEAFFHHWEGHNVSDIILIYQWWDKINI